MSCPECLTNHTLNSLTSPRGEKENVQPNRNQCMAQDLPSSTSLRRSAMSSSGMYMRSNSRPDEAHKPSKPRRGSRQYGLPLNTDHQGNVPTSSLWVGNRPIDLTEDELLDKFSEYGEILSVRVPPRMHYAFVNYASVDAAIKAWNECHGMNAFGGNGVLELRYQGAPTSLKETHAVAKRKRNSDVVALSPTYEIKRPIPTGPKALQSDISPPPLRRYDTYKPPSASAERWTERPLKRIRSSDVYRPSYDQDRCHHRDLDEDRAVDNCDNGNCVDQTHGRSPHDRCGVAQPANVHPTSPTGRSHSLTAINDAHSTRWSSDRLETDAGMPDTNISIPPIGAETKASDKINISNIGYSKFEYRNTSAAVREQQADGLDIQESETPSRSCVPIDNSGESACQNAISTVQNAKTVSLRQTETLLSCTATSSKSSEVHAPERSVLKGFNEVSSEIVSTTGPGPAFESVLQSDSADATFLNLPLAEKKGFPYLTHLLATKEKADRVEAKARTISPFGRVRASSRDTASIKSAKTDPTPSTRPMLETCNSCKMTTKNHNLSKCAARSCKKKIHIICGKRKYSSNSTAAEGPDSIILDKTDSPQGSTQQMPIICDGYSEAETQGQRPTLTNPSQSRPGKQKIFANKVQVVDDVCSTDFISWVKVPQGNFDDTHPLNRGSVATTGGTENLAQVLFKRIPTSSNSNLPTPSIPETVFRAPERPPETFEAISGRGKRAPIRTVTMEESYKPEAGVVSREAAQVAARYKTQVTCPWWKKTNSFCRLRPEECMFAHRMTGIESPNGHSPAKDWTCYEFATYKVCRFPEDKCLYSHTNTGLYAGLDGKASKKHLECRFWRLTGRCKHSEDLCIFAHVPTGLLAEDPKSKDMFRKLPMDALVALSDLNAASREPQSAFSSSTTTLPILRTSSPTDKVEASEHVSREFAASSVRAAVPPKVAAKQSSRMPQAAAIADPRLHRNVVSEVGNGDTDTFTETTLSHEASFTGTSQPFRSNDELNAEAPVGQTALKASTMGSCKKCSKRVFKAEICTDCLNAGQRRDSIEKVTRRHSIEQIDSYAGPIESQPATTSLVRTAPKVLKRHRSGSSSVLFASKRIRPNLAITHSSYGNRGDTSDDRVITQPLTLEELNRRNAERKAEEILQTTSGSKQPNQVLGGDLIETPTTLSPHPISHSCTPTRMSSVESPVELSESSKTLPINQRLYSPAKVEKCRTTPKTAEASSRPSVVSEYGKLANCGVDRDNSSDDDDKNSDEAEETAESDADEEDSDLDIPLANLRKNMEKSLWSPSTVNDSSKGSEIELETAAPIFHSTVSSGSVSSGPSTRCSSCTRYHRKCVHGTDGALDGRKCYEWHYSTVQRKTNFSERQRREIKLVAEAYKANLEMPTKSVNPSNQERLNESQHERRHVEQKQRTAPPNVPARTSKSSTIGEARMPSPVSSMHESVQLAEAEISSSARIGLESSGSSSNRSEEARIEGILSRLQAQGVRIEEFDSEDEPDRETVQECDRRIDPLVLHNRRSGSPTPPLQLPKITKGEGLKVKNCISQRRMLRNKMVFGDLHKEVHRAIYPQQVTAMFQRKDEDDPLEPAEDSLEQMTFHEFLGVGPDVKMEACLARKSLARGQATLELAFRERDTAKGPELSAWGRERRGVRKEKPVYLVGGSKVG